MLSSCIGVVMKDGALLRSSSLFIAYMGCLGWGSAYFYGWGTSFYYGFPWWIVGAGVDEVTISIRSYGRFLSVSCFYDKPFIKKHFFEIVMIAFVAYFWLFSFLTGYYKPQFKKEYEMINYNDGWYYVLARYDNCLVLSTSFNAGSKRFVIYQSAQDKNLQVDIVRTRI
ncbi:membrane protein [Escherichia coli]|uniref:hypothetical protein n=1 Tax=Escherichia coli TaxID=562 RepID=UPI0010AF9C9B|nr:hypothetical protein [Escherichia coli]GCJ91442.1 membrane protein [Escherichia coli]